ncbi:helix-turn-helix transcriptional regulator [Pantoea sp.]|uniref:helix-turn-helix transcriptional regulator n=1 Tax=Pantoea sp. TaxID=69393 RepID=UPI00289C79BD|nr:LuxR C-terminal-related transcriptional regulator [Pantoea sp.]
MEPSSDTASYISHLITMINAFGDPWGLKSPTSEHIYMNREARLFTTTPDKFDLEGRRDSEFPADWAEMEMDLIAHDHRACHSDKSSLVIETHHWYGLKEVTPYLSEKYPVCDSQGNCIAILWYAKPVFNIDPLMLIDCKKPGIITTASSCALFTASEKETLFYLLRGLTAKDIARINNVSHKTIGNRIQTIFQKADVHSFRQLKEFCRYKGISDYIPPHLLKKGLITVR